MKPLWWTPNSDLPQQKPLWWTPNRYLSQQKQLRWTPNSDLLKQKPLRWTSNNDLLKRNHCDGLPVVIFDGNHCDGLTLAIFLGITHCDVVLCLLKREGNCRQFSSVQLVAISIEGSITLAYIYAIYILYVQYCSWPLNRAKSIKFLE